MYITVVFSNIGERQGTEPNTFVLLRFSLVFAFRSSLAETRDYSQPFSQNNSSRVLNRALAAESNRFGHYIFADILTLCPYSVPFQEYTASTVCYLFIRKYQEKISAVCLNLYRQELRRWIMKPFFHFVLIWVWKLDWRLDVTQRLPSVTWQHCALLNYHRVTKTAHKIIFFLYEIAYIENCNVYWWNLSFLFLADNSFNKHSWNKHHYRWCGVCHRFLQVCLSLCIIFLSSQLQLVNIRTVNVSSRPVLSRTAPSRSYNYPWVFKVYGNSSWAKQRKQPVLLLFFHLIGENLSNKKR